MKRNAVTGAMVAMVALLAGCGDVPPRSVEVKHGAATGDAIGPKFVVPTGKQFAQQVPASTSLTAHTNDFLGQFALSSNGYQANLAKGTAWNMPDYVNGSGLAIEPADAWTLYIGPGIDGVTHNDIDCVLHTLTQVHGSVSQQNAQFPSWISQWLPSDFPIQGNSMFMGAPSSQSVTCHAHFWEWGDRQASAWVFWYDPNQSYTNHWVATRPTNATYMVVQINVGFPEYGVINRYYFKFAR